MAYVSELLGRRVTDVEGEPVGRVDDLIASHPKGTLHPAIVALSVRRGRATLLVPFTEVGALAAPTIPLNSRLIDLPAYQASENDFYLARDILDRQIIDTNGVRVVRVNDLELARVNHHYYIANVDVGPLGLLRRLGVARGIQRMMRTVRRPLRPVTISWHDTEFLPGDRPMRLKVPGERIAELHPADLAEIISDLSRAESGRLLDTLDVETLAETLEEVEPDFQASLVEHMPDAKVAGVLDEMAPDEAADLLATLPPERSKDLLKLMGDEAAEDVERLLVYRPDTAGGIMNTEFISVPPDLTAGQAIDILRKIANEAETIAYVYVTEPEGKLVGVLALPELVLADPNRPIAEFMHRRLVTVGLEDAQDVVAQAIAKYNLVAIPVIDPQGRIHGIVTADDALDKVIPTAWKKRLPHLYH